MKSIDGKYLKESEEVHVGFEGQLGLHKVTPRELLSPFLGSLVCVEGIVTKCEKRILVGKGGCRSGKEVSVPGSQWPALVR